MRKVLMILLVLVAIGGAYTLWSNRGGKEPEIGGNNPPTTSESSTVSGSFVSGGKTRTYLLHKPQTVEGKKYPLMFSFHGMGGTGSGQQKKTGFDAVADTYGFFVVYPSALGDQWQPLGAGNDIDATNELLELLKENYPIDASRIYVSGFSAGGGFAEIMACAASHRIAGFANVSSNMTPRVERECKPTTPITALLMHGTGDEVSPYEPGPNYRGVESLGTRATVLFWVSHNKCNSTPIAEQIPDTLSDGSKVTDTKTTWSGCSSGTKVILYKIENGGHAWPGGVKGNLDLGPASSLNASEIIWQTLSAYHR